MSYYLKVPKVLKILEDNAESCEGKLENLKKLISQNSPFQSNVNSKQTSGGAAATETDGTDGGGGLGDDGKYENLVKDITSVTDRKLALSLLYAIESSNVLSWSDSNLQLIVDGEEIKYTNISHLLKKVVTPLPASMPLGTVLFIDGLLKIKAPLNAIRSGDAKEILSNLQKVHSAKVDSSTSSTEESNENVENDVQSNGDGVNMRENVKRPRSVDDDDDSDGPVSKQQRREETDDLPKRRFDLDDTRLKKLRRSPRLRKEISDVWKES